MLFMYINIFIYIFTAKLFFIFSVSTTFIKKNEKFYKNTHYTPTLLYEVELM
jgi:hypothetical protein